MTKPFVFFDAAGTLFHLREPVGHGYSRIAAKFGFSLDPDQATQAFGRAFRGMESPTYPPKSTPSENEAIDHAWWRLLVADVFARCDEDPAKPSFDDCFNELFQHYGNAEAWQLFPDAKPALEILKSAGIPAGVLSNFDARLIPILYDLKIADDFAEIAVSSQLGNVKPNRECYTAAAALAGAALDACILIGDDPIRDQKGALDAGFRAAYLVHRPSSTLESIVSSIAKPTEASLDRN